MERHHHHHCHRHHHQQHHHGGVNNATDRERARTASFLRGTWEPGKAAWPSKGLVPR